MISRHELMVVRTRLMAAILLVWTLSACVGAAREPVVSLSSLSSGETVVVGRVELVPPLRKDEQKLNYHQLNQVGWRSRRRRLKSSPRSV